MSGADSFWRSVIESGVRGWLGGFVFNDPQSRRWVALQEFYSRWNSGRIILPSLPPITVFAPDENEAGSVVRRDPLPNSVFMYLAPFLEFDNQQDVSHDVVHELAHIALGHPFVSSKDDVELEADALVEQWGFGRKPIEAERTFNQMTKQYFERLKAEQVEEKK